MRRCRYDWKRQAWREILDFEDVYHVKIWRFIKRIRMWNYFYELRN